MRQIHDGKYNCFPRNHHDAAPNNCRHSEDFENAGVIFGAGKTWRMGADFQRATKHLLGVAFSAVTQACSLMCRAGL
jgi:hypothetical protein